MADLGNSTPRSGSQNSAEEEAHVASLLQKMNLTHDEGAFAAFSDDEEEADDVREWALIGKVLSPSTLHITTITNAMRPAWGNPFGLTLRSIGEKGENLFIAEFGCQEDKFKAMNGSPWMVGKHAVILREYDETLKPSDICFSHMEMWVHILNLPLGWMNEKRGTRAAELIGEVVKIDTGADGKISGEFVRARVAIDIEKPLRRGVLLKTDRTKLPDWYEIQYEKLPFFCFSCALLGHTHLECPTPAPRNVLGKLPYELKLRAPDDRRKKPQSFGAAAADSFGNSSGSGRTSTTRQSSNAHPQTPEEGKGKGKADDEEATSPLKQKGRAYSRKGANPKKVFAEKKQADVLGQRKRKPGENAVSELKTPAASPIVVPSGLVSDRIAQLANVSGQAEIDSEMQKKQKVSNNTNAGSAAAALDSPRRAQ